MILDMGDISYEYMHDKFHFEEEDVKNPCVEASYDDYYCEQLIVGGMYYDVLGFHILTRT